MTIKSTKKKSKGSSMVKSNVKQLMKAKNEKIRQLVERIDISRQTLMRARDDATVGSCSVDTLYKIAVALGVSVKDLFDELPLEENQNSAYCEEKN